MEVSEYQDSVSGCIVKIEINTLKCDLTVVMVQVKVFKKSFLIFDKIVN